MSHRRRPIGGDVRPQGRAAAGSALIGCALLLAVAGLAGCGDGGALDRLAQGPRARVASAPTGDRLRLDGGREVLLAGIEAPSPGAPFGEQSRALLDRLARGRTVDLLRAGPPPDPSNSGAEVAQARLYPSRAWLEGSLLDAGAAWVRTAADDRALAPQMLAREAAARAARRGLWALPDYGVRLPDEVEPGEHGFRIVEGRVIKAGRFGPALYLDFARDWRRAVSVYIPTRALRDFRAAGLDPLSLTGRLIRVRGVVRADKGAPVLTLDHPEAIELLAEPAR